MRATSAGAGAQPWGLGYLGSIDARPSLRLYQIGEVSADLFQDSERNFINSLGG